MMMAFAVICFAGAYVYKKEDSDFMASVAMVTGISSVIIGSFTS